MCLRVLGQRPGGGCAALAGRSIAIVRHDRQLGSTPDVMFTLIRPGFKGLAMSKSWMSRSKPSFRGHRHSARGFPGNTARRRQRRCIGNNRGAQERLAVGRMELCAGRSAR
jgi:hypothetical protein